MCTVTYPFFHISLQKGNRVFLSNIHISFHIILSNWLVNNFLTHILCSYTELGTNQESTKYPTAIIHKLHPSKGTITCWGNLWIQFSKHSEFMAYIPPCISLLVFFHLYLNEKQSGFFKYRLPDFQQSMPKKGRQLPYAPWRENDRV